MSVMEYKKQLGELKVAIVHDWLVSLGGAERVVASLLNLFPQADLYTSVYDPKKVKLFRNKEVKTSFLQKWPLALKKHQLFASLRPLAFESFDFKGYDLVISSSSAESKGVITSSETLHISYIHTPIRYYWSGYEEYLRNPGFGVINPAVRLIMPNMVAKLRKWDYAAAQRPDYLIANSRVVQERIEKYYNRSSIVINPPVDIERFEKSNLKTDDKKEDFYLVVSRLVPYKRVDIAIEAFNKLNRKLIIAGRGPELKNLKKLANENITFIENPSEEKVTDLYRKARAFIFSAEEDFGITPLEAMASATPVICYGSGGVVETVISGKTGLYHNKQTPESLMGAVLKFEKIEFDDNVLVKRANDFSEQVFMDKFGGYIVDKVNQKKQSS